MAPTDMNAGDRTALEALQRRLGHVEAIADLCASQDDTPLGEAMRGIAAILADLSERLEAVLSGETAV